MFLFASENCEKQDSLYLLLVFCVTTSLLYADQNLMAPNLTAIAKCKWFNILNNNRILTLKPWKDPNPQSLEGINSLC